MLAMLDDLKVAAAAAVHPAGRSLLPLLLDAGFSTGWRLV
jgi:hypothetical protein